MKGMTLHLEDLSSRDPKIKYACAKMAIAVSREDPGELYPHLDFFVTLSEGENQIIRWAALQVIGNLSRVDGKKKIDRLIPRLAAFLRCGKMITAAHAIGALAQIAAHKPEHRGGILKELIKVEKYTYDTPECRNVAIGHVINALAGFKDEVKNRKDSVMFLKRQTKNTRAAVRKKAGELLKSLVSAAGKNGAKKKSR
ncbi:MAG: hypothetical protein NTZ78_02835 [Candidatus Aureabacteria bacterium]|nr:hypothetical protein [Candidatus Auribacterota bacterium]